jgi:hypothetical protein
MINGSHISKEGRQAGHDVRPDLLLADIFSIIQVLGSRNQTTLQFVAKTERFFPPANPGQAISMTSKREWM